MKNSIILYIIIATLIGGAGGFLAGIKFQEQQRSTMSARIGTNMMQPGTFRGQNVDKDVQVGRVGMMNRPIFGTVTSNDDNSITISLEDGSSKIIMLSDETSYTTSQTASKSDLKSQVKVSVVGKENNDGSLTATSIMLNPQERVQLFK